MVSSTGVHPDAKGLLLALTVTTTKELRNVVLGPTVAAYDLHIDDDIEVTDRDLIGAK